MLQTRKAGPRGTRPLETARLLVDVADEGRVERDAGGRLERRRLAGEGPGRTRVGDDGRSRLAGEGPDARRVEDLEAARGDREGLRVQQGARRAEEVDAAGDGGGAVVLDEVDGHLRGGVVP